MPALKGPNRIAQGNALGPCGPSLFHPEGVAQILSCPFRQGRLGAGTGTQGVALVDLHKLHRPRAANIEQVRSHGNALVPTLRVGTA
jgi:hypothetical protein